MTRKTIKINIIVGTSLIILKNFEDLILELSFKADEVFVLIGLKLLFGGSLGSFNPKLVIKLLGIR